MREKYHNGVGRLDQWLYPYWRNDLDGGRITHDEAFSLLEEFFLSFNRDSDLYVGVQQGDNGQGLMIGGCTRDGRDAWNGLSEAILVASCELKLIDPKINFRVTADTPIKRLELGARLTCAGWASRSTPTTMWCCPPSKRGATSRRMRATTRSRHAGSSSFRASATSS